MELSELQPGHTYVFDFNFINLIDSDGKIRHWINITGKDYLKDCCDVYESDIRKTTPEEDLWLKTCVKIGKFIPLEEVFKYNELNNSYPIF